LGYKIMKDNYLEFNISEHFLCALINDDYSGLDDDDVEALKLFLSGLPSGYFAYDGNGSIDFVRCEITDLYSDCARACYQIYSEVTE
jgi:hypothetical protein